MIHTIQNDFIKISVSEKGAELQRIVELSTEQEYMWSGNAAYWGKYSPVLFPVVGTLKDNSYYFDGKSYRLPRHGFAREMDFILHRQTADTLSFLLKSTDGTLEKYPFEFEFYIDYVIQAGTLFTTYRVINRGTTAMYFSVGGHPAFKVPLFEEERYEDYRLELNCKETVGKWPISQDGLIETLSEPFLENENIIRLKKELFYKDAVVLKHLRSNQVKLVSERSGKGFLFDFTGFPYLGIWAAKNADFVCIEPWCGIADSVDSNQQLKDKEGINLLEPGSEFNRTWHFAPIV